MLPLLLNLTPRTFPAKAGTHPEVSPTRHWLRQHLRLGDQTGHLGNCSRNASVELELKTVRIKILRVKTAAAVGHPGLDAAVIGALGAARVDAALAQRHLVEDLLLLRIILAADRDAEADMQPRLGQVAALAGEGRGGGKGEAKGKSVFHRAHQARSFCPHHG